MIKDWIVSHCPNTSLLLEKVMARHFDTQAAEEKAEHEAKMAKISAIEEAKQRDRLIGKQ